MSLANHGVIIKIMNNIKYILLLLVILKGCDEYHREYVEKSKMIYLIDQNLTKH